MKKNYDANCFLDYNGGYFSRNIIRWGMCFFGT